MGKSLHEAVTYPYGPAFAHLVAVLNPMSFERHRTGTQQCVRMALFLAISASSCRNHPATLFTQLLEARKIASELRIAFGKADQATNQAVMAISDEMSIEYAGKAEQALTIVDADVASLELHLRAVGGPKEMMLLKRFAQELASYRALDRTIRDLTVQNSNLKAQRIAFGPASKAASTFKTSLTQMARLLPANNAARANALIAEAVIAVREIQVLYPPHIAEPEDAPMTAIEERVADLQREAAAALNALSMIVDRRANPNFDKAHAAFENFTTLGAEIVRLSRRNSNVRSLALSLGEKPALAGACDNTLGLLQSALAEDPFSGTR